MKRRFSLNTQALFLTLIALTIFTCGIKQQEIIGFEARFFLFAREMWEHGFSFFPTSYGVPYPDYPGLPTYLIVLCAKLVGLNKLAGVLPSALAAAGTVGITYLIGCEQSRECGFAASCFLLLTYTFFSQARTISPDSLVTFFTVLFFYLSIVCKENIFFSALLILPLSFFCRGPIGLIIPVSVVCSALLINNEWKKLITFSLYTLLLLSLCLLGLLVAAYQSDGITFVQDVIRMQVTGRMIDASLPWYFYYSESLGAYALTFGLVLLMSVNLKTLLRADRIRILQFVAWVAVIMIGMSIPAGKKIRYILAISPALALLSGYFYATPFTDKYFVFLKKSLLLLLSLLPLLGIIFSMIVLVFFKNVGLNFSHLILLCIILLILQSLIFYWRSAQVILACATLAFAGLYIFIVEPINLLLNQTKRFVIQVENARQKDRAQLVFYREHPDALPIKYIVNMPILSTPLFINNLHQLNKIPNKTWVITESIYAADLGKDWRFITSGKIGHEAVSVFEKWVQ